MGKDLENQELEDASKGLRFLVLIFRYGAIEAAADCQRD
jgi:hypothetical protein